MAEVKWIKLATDIFDDEKIKIIESLPKADTLLVIWFKLLCLAGKQNNGGVFCLGSVPYTEKMFATILGRPLNTVKTAFEVFENFGMIERIDGTVTIPNWEKHQSLDAYERRKEQNKINQRKFKEKQKEIAKRTADSNQSVSNTVSSQSAKISNADKEEDKDIDIDIEIYKEKHPKGCKEKADSVPKSDASKHRHGEYGHVLLSDGEFEKLKAEYPNADELIAFLDEYIEMKGYKARNHYLCIKKWVVSAVGERKKKSEGKGNGISDKHKEWAELERFMEGENGKSDEDI